MKARRLIAIAIAAGLITSPAIADDKLTNAAETAAFVIACPKHWERLPPRTQRLMTASVDDVSKLYDKDTMRRATLEAYAKGYDKQGERWCARMESVFFSAGNF